MWTWFGNCMRKAMWLLFATVTFAACVGVHRLRQVNADRRMFDNALRENRQIVIESLAVKVGYKEVLIADERGTKYLSHSISRAVSSGSSPRASGFPCSTTIRLADLGEIHVRLITAHESGFSIEMSDYLGPNEPTYYWVALDEPVPTSVKHLLRLMQE